MGQLAHRAAGGPRSAGHEFAADGGRISRLGARDRGRDGAGTATATGVSFGARIGACTGRWLRQRRDLRARSPASRSRCRHALQAHTLSRGPPGARERKVQSSGWNGTTWDNMDIMKTIHLPSVPRPQVEPISSGPVRVVEHRALSDRLARTRNSAVRRVAAGSFPRRAPTAPSAARAGGRPQARAQAASTNNALASHVLRGGRARSEDGAEPAAWRGRDARRPEGPSTKRGRQPRRGRTDLPDARGRREARRGAEPACKRKARLRARRIEPG
jgi:hypothetical protein